MDVGPCYKQLLHYVWCIGWKGIRWLKMMQLLHCKLQHRITMDIDSIGISTSRQ
jgi:hypothetical protein